MYLFSDRTGEKHIQIFDMSGKEVFKGQVYNQFDIGRIIPNKGIYYLKVQTTITTKFYKTLKR